MDKRELCKYDRWIPTDATFKTSYSTYDADYVKFDSKPKQRIKSADAMVLKQNMPFVKKSGYKDEYVEHSLPDYYFMPRSDSFTFKTNKRFYTPNDLGILKGLSQPENPNSDAATRRVSLESRQIYAKQNGVASKKEEFYSYT